MKEINDLIDHKQFTNNLDLIGEIKENIELIKKREDTKVVILLEIEDEFTVFTTVEEYQEFINEKFEIEEKFEFKTITL